MIACDCHVHVFGPRDRYPQLDTRAYTAGVASLDSLQRHANPLGITRFVIVQASVNGLDNSYLLDTLDSLDGQGRGVVVVDPRAVTPRALEEMYERGVRGLRLNLYSDYHVADAQRIGPRLEALLDLAPDGWHVEVIAPLRVLVDAASTLAGSRVPIVIGHYGLPGSHTPQNSHGRVLLDLLRQPHVWMKLSGPYRATERPGSDSLSTTPPAEWLKAFVETAPQRLVWGS